MTDYVVCPKCKRRVLNQASIRQGVIHGTNVIDIGYECPKCRHEWGFKFFKTKASKKKLKKVM